MPARATRYLLFTTKVQQKEIVPVPSPIRMARRFAWWSDEASTKGAKKDGVLLVKWRIISRFSRLPHS